MKIEPLGTLNPNSSQRRIIFDSECMTFCIDKLFNIYSDEFTGQSYDGNVYNPDFLCPALRASIGGCSYDFTW